MNKRLLDYYEQELRFLREQGREFAAAHPAVAERLGIDDEEIADPYVRHLTQSFAFLAARVAMRFDDEFPTLSQGLLSVVDPMILRPVPSAVIVQLEPNHSILEKPKTLQRGAELRSSFSSSRPACRFHTAHDVTLIPLRVSEAHYLGRDLPSLGVQAPGTVRAAFALTVESTRKTPISHAAFDELEFFIHGGENTPGAILEQLHTDATEVVVRTFDDKGKMTEAARLSADSIQESGLEPEQAMLPVEPRSFDGLRLLSEYFIMPRRCFFARFTGLREVVAQANGKKMQIVVLLNRRVETLESIVTADNFRLFCTPAINLFSRICDRIDLLRNRHEYDIIPDRTLPLDYEIYSIQQVTGFGTSTPMPFRAFYASTDEQPDAGAYFMTRRVRKEFEDSARTRIGRNEYTASQMYLSVVDASRAPYDPDLKQLEVKALCTSGVGAAELASRQGDAQFKLLDEAPVKSVTALVGPTPPRIANIEGADAWKLIDRLSLNYLRISGGEAGADAMRSMLQLFSDPDRADLELQIRSLTTIESESVTRPIVESGHLAWCRGMKVSPTFDEDGFTGVGVFALGSVLNRYLCAFCSMNSFTETSLCTTQRGQIKTWPPRSGSRRIL